MLKHIAVALAAMLLAGIATLPTPTHATIQYPWCVQYGGGREGYGATSCGFVSRAQCMETASGMRAMCVENPAYNGPSEYGHKSRHKKKHKN